MVPSMPAVPATKRSSPSRLKPALSRVSVAEMEELIYERTGAKPGTFGGFFSLTPRVDDIPDRFSIEHRGIRFLRLGSIESFLRARVVLMKCTVGKGEMSAHGQSQLEMEECTVRGPGPFRAFESGRVRLTRCRLEAFVKLVGFDSGILEAWEMGRVPTAELHDHSKFLIDGRERE